MGSVTRGRNHGSNSSNAIESGSEKRPWTSQLFKAEQNISVSSQKLEHAFKDIDFESLQVDSISHVPSPIKMIRRLTALEIAIGKLRQDCETISRKRNQLVQSVIADQNNNVTYTKKMEDMESSLDYPKEDTNWNELSQEMKVQLDLFDPTITKFDI
mmetsp:Transcript_27563/g.60669  ORF Transcript_27563/g.60669 Transcript_27563/m.60669 type:complete len:157 (-) Transcript_27563:730-1200(-)